METGYYLLLIATSLGVIIQSARVDFWKTFAQSMKEDAKFWRDACTRELDGDK